MFYNSNIYRKYLEMLTGKKQYGDGRVVISVPQQHMFPEKILQRYFVREESLRKFGKGKYDVKTGASFINPWDYNVVIATKDCNKVRRLIFDIYKYYEENYYDDEGIDIFLSLKMRVF